MAVACATILIYNQDKNMKLKSLIICLAFLLLPLTSFAYNPGNKCSIEFFASNNTQTIDLATALQRLQGNEQNALLEATIELMQKNHVQQGKFTNILGVYKFSASPSMTADNSEIYSTSCYQTIPTNTALSYAKELASTLNQESVAVFIPKAKSSIGEITVTLSSHQYTLDEVIKIINNEVPSQFRQAYSLSLDNSHCTQNAIITQIEWLGSKLNPNDLKNAFPKEQITVYQGNAYLVYSNGQTDIL